MADLLQAIRVAVATRAVADLLQAIRVAVATRAVADLLQAIRVATILVVVQPRASRAPQVAAVLSRVSRTAARTPAKARVPKGTTALATVRMMVSPVVRRVLTPPTLLMAMVTSLAVAKAARVALLTRARRTTMASATAPNLPTTLTRM